MLEERISLSAFFQVTETRVEGKIQQLPVIGTWRLPDRNIFCVAVGEMINAAGHRLNITHTTNLSEKKFGGVKNHADIVDIEGEEPFISLLRISPVLCQNGGVRGFLLGKSDKVLMAVGSASLQRSLAKTGRVAQLRALRSLLGHRQEIQISSVEYLSDQEQLRLSKHGAQSIFLSQFLSIQKEQISGIVRALPIVATWQDPERQVLYVAIGKSFQQID